MIIRQTDAFSERLVQIHALSFEQGWQEGAFRALLSQPHHYLWGVFEEDDLRSFVLLSLVAGEAEILTLATDPACRRQGLAGRLLRHVLGELRSEGAETVFLEVAVDNPAALGLYDGLGFGKVGLRKAYYSRRSGPPVDGHMLRLRLEKA